MVPFGFIRNNNLCKVRILYIADSKENCGIDTECVFRASLGCQGEPWVLSQPKDGLSSSTENSDDSEKKPDLQSNKICQQSWKNHQNEYSDEEYFQAIALNIVRELMQQKKKKQEERRKTPLTRSAFKLHSSISKISPSTGQDDITSHKEGSMNSALNKNLPDDLPNRVVELVDTILKESEKVNVEKKESEKAKSDPLPVITFNIWDYTGHPKFFMLHQLFLSPQTIYLLVFDLSQELYAQVLGSDDKDTLEYLGVSSLSPLTIIHMWLELIYACVSHSAELEEFKENGSSHEIGSLFPPVIIVGTRKDALSDEEQVEQRFSQIKASLEDKVYSKHVLPKFYALNSENNKDDETLRDLRKKVEEISFQLSHVGMEIPLKWISFEHAIDRLLERQVYFADINKLSEVARLENIESEEEFRSMVHFFHHKGKIWHLGSDILECNGIVILNPQWFINYIYKLLNLDITSKEKVSDLPESEEKAKEDNIVDAVQCNTISAECLEKVWPNAFHHIGIFLGILDCADIICELPYAKIDTNDHVRNEKSYFLPWLSQFKPDPENVSSDKLDLILEFSNLLPVGFFTRFLIRLYRWSKHYYSCEKKSNHVLCQKTFAIDYSHDITVIQISSNRIMASLTQRKSSDSAESVVSLTPMPHICCKLRHVMMKEAEHLLDNWYKRLSFNLCVPCPCDKKCDTHGNSYCSKKECLHLLTLSKCLSKKIVECDYRLVKTDFVQKYFGSSTLEDSDDYKVHTRLSDDLTFSSPSANKSFWEDHNSLKEEPQWLRECAKMLTMSNTGRDWVALAKRLGYREKEVIKFQADIYPPVSLLSNWLESNGQTRYCIDLLISCLEQMGRHDVVERIQADMGLDSPATPVFISYQCDAQDIVLHLRRRLELAGYPCWMDIGHLRGGDSLYGQIYEGISQAKVVLCCLTPRYALSPICSREISLADVLRKPIVPVMVEPTPWPPPGPIALILSSLVYIDLCDIGGHGGCGQQADWESHFETIIDRISHFTSPMFSALSLSATPACRIISLCSSYPAKTENHVRELENRDSVMDIVTTDEGDETSLASSTREQASGTPATWVQSRPNNTVLRCSICILL